MLPMTFFRNRAFSLANLASLLMFFGMFGSIFLLAQFFQVVQGYTPLQAGLRTLPWTAMPIFVAPIAGALSDRIGGRPLMAAQVARILKYIRGFPGVWLVRHDELAQWVKQNDIAEWTNEQRFFPRPT